MHQQLPNMRLNNGVMTFSHFSKNSIVTFPSDVIPENELCKQSWAACKAAEPSEGTELDDNPQ